MKRASLLLAGFLLLPFSVQADDSTKQELVNKLLTITKAEQLIESTHNQTGQMLMGMAQQMGITEKEKPLLDEYMKNISDDMAKEFTWDKLKEPLGNIYTKHYTEDELADLVTFYETDTGKKMIEKMPLIAAESIQLSQSMLADFLPKMKVHVEALQTKLAELRKSEAANAPETAPTPVQASDKK